MQRIALLLVSAEGLRILVENIAQHAQLWRETFYLDMDDEKPGPVAA